MAQIAPKNCKSQRKKALKKLLCCVRLNSTDTYFSHYN
ncbi:hypothetical protein CCACVL1_26925 [Corchorus capsularis]|uniref:Uncharacterized protein n=1 Tax=Corchorus capsularis TaxID=210143 RepID=A0A1R3GCW8_COCAP|nr:hypothetical protein CCACVL1_26925 [Corchorus capsularis]